jgi:hypothetical protein
LGPDTGAIDEVLQLIGVFVSFSIAFVSYKGVRRTDSTTLMRLTTAFVFLGLGFLVEGLVGLNGSLFWLPSITATMVIVGLVLETTGYFFLAFSHAVDVMLSRRLALSVLIFPVLAFNGTELSNILSILSFYFVLYGVVETLYSYRATRRPDTLLIASGLALLAGGIAAQWLSIVYISVNLLPLVEILLKELGLMTLFVPVLSYVFGRERVNGPV